MGALALRQPQRVQLFRGQRTQRRVVQTLAPGGGKPQDSPRDVVGFMQLALLGDNPADLGIRRPHPLQQRPPDTAVANFQGKIRRPAGHAFEQLEHLVPALG